MPGLYRDEGVILRTIKLGEADRIATIFTRDNGKVRAVAKGVRKTKSRFGARLEPYTRVHLLIYRGRGELDTITSADIVDPFKGLRSDFGRLTAAAALVELVEKITPDRERADSTYDLLLGGLGALSDGRGSSVVPGFVVKLLSISGYHPQLSVCSGCGGRAGIGGFSPALGGVVCDTCWHQDPGALRLEPDRIALLSRLLSDDFGYGGLESLALADITQALRRYAEYHLERPLKSLHLLATA